MVLSAGKSRSASDAHYDNHRHHHHHHHHHHHSYNHTTTYSHSQETSSIELSTADSQPSTPQHLSHLGDDTPLLDPLSHSVDNSASGLNGRGDVSLASRESDHPAVGNTPSRPRVHDQNRIGLVVSVEQDVDMMAEATLDSGLCLEHGEGGGEEGGGGDVDDLDSPSSMHRIQSESTIQQPDGCMETRRNDPYKSLERSQSDASLLHNAEPENELPVRLTAAESSSSARNVSECNRVYLDLSRAEPFERVEFADSMVSMFRSSSGRQLETIPQDEELKTGDLSHLYASRRSFSNDSSTSSLEDVSGHGKVKAKDVNPAVKHVKTTRLQEKETTKMKTNLKSSVQIYSHTLKQKVRTLQMGSVPEQVNALDELNVLMEQAWSMPVYGKDLAYSLCDILRTEKALDIIISNLTSSNRELLKASARLLEQTLTTHNRKQVAESGLETVVKMTCDYQVSGDWLIDLFD